MLDVVKWLFETLLGGMSMGNCARRKRAGRVAKKEEDQYDQIKLKPETRLSECGETVLVEKVGSTPLTDAAADGLLIA